MEEQAQAWERVQDEREEYSARIRWTDAGGKRGGAVPHGILRGMRRLYRLKPPGAEALAARGIETPLGCAGWMLPGETCDGTRSAEVMCTGEGSSGTRYARRGGLERGM